MYYSSTAVCIRSPESRVYCVKPRSECAHMTSEVGETVCTAVYTHTCPTLRPYTAVLTYRGPCILRYTYSRTCTAVYVCMLYARITYGDKVYGITHDPV
jgi:hypothetical protein